MDQYYRQSNNTLTNRVSANVVKSKQQTAQLRIFLTFNEKNNALQD